MSNTGSFPGQPNPASYEKNGPGQKRFREFAARPNVLLCDEHAFESLEHPELFKDAFHLNREGSTQFSKLLVEELRRVLGPPRNLQTVN